MKYIKRPTEFPAVIGYNRLISDNEPTHKFLRGVGIDQNEPNYVLIIEFVQRFLKDLHKVDYSAYKDIRDMLHEYDIHETQKEETDKRDTDMHKQICQRIKNLG